jgi:hypothetical protein
MAGSKSTPMRAGFSAKSISIFFIAVLVFYFAAFYGCEYMRHRKGPWEVQFITDNAGRPSIVVFQPKRGISSFEILFHGEQIEKTNLSQRVAFDRPLKLVPFGKVIYEDLTFLPGVVTFDLFGHEIELLPRVLIVNKKEVPWKSDTTLELSPTNKLAQVPRSPQRR